MIGRKYKKGFIPYKEAIACYNAIGKLGQIGPISKDTPSLYHYTSTNVLDAIFNTGTFRASNLFYLNDEIEYKMGINTLRRVFAKHDKVREYIDEISVFDGKSSGGVYSISYSDRPDILQQWITYAKEDGVCIELNGKFIWGNGADKLWLGIKSEKDTNIRLKGCCFLRLAYAKPQAGAADKSPQLEADKIRQVFAEAIQEVKGESTVLDEENITKLWEEESEYAKHFLQLLAAYYKEERFQGEGEIRAAFLPVCKTQTCSSKISYFCQKDGVLRPYMDVQFLHWYEDRFEEECPIKSIMVGPGGKQQSVFDSIVHRLKHGTVKSWNYDDAELGELLSQYIFGSYSLVEEGNDGVYLALAWLLAWYWCEEKEYKFEIKKATRTEVKVVVSKDADGVWRKGEKGTFEKNRREAGNHADKYMRDNYLSEMGIWVKKSSISYIF